MNEAVETAARHYCEKMGVDPDKMIAHGAEPDERGFVPAVCLYSAQWRLVAKQILAATAMSEAVELYKCLKK